MKKQITYRLASAGDVPLLIDLRVEFLTEHWGAQERSVEERLRQELHSYFMREVSSGDYLAWLAFEEDRIAGTGGMKISQRPGSFRFPDGRSAYIMNMYTLPAFRRQGIAQKIMEKLMQSGRELGIRYFDLHATEEGEPLYLKNGFVTNEQPNLRKLFT
jgi:GNAT superfamily N-acetyltransferase